MITFSSCSSSSSDRCCQNCDTPFPTRSTSTSSSSSSLFSDSSFSHHYNCIECESSSFRLTCLDCCIQIHRPSRKREHRIQKIKNWNAIQIAIGKIGGEEEEEKEREIGFGFCQYCVASYDQQQKQSTSTSSSSASSPSSSSSSPLPVPSLSQLHCPDCHLNLCFPCDFLLHKSYDRSSHVREQFEIDYEIDEEEYEIGSEKIQLFTVKSMSSYAGTVWSGAIYLGRFLEKMYGGERIQKLDRVQQSYIRVDSGTGSASASTSSASSTSSHNSASPSSSLSSLSGLCILELGSGCGAIPSFASFLLGASCIVITDMNADAMEIVDKSVHKIQSQLKSKYEIGTNGIGGGGGKKRKDKKSTRSKEEERDKAGLKEMRDRIEGMEKRIRTRRLKFGDRREEEECLQLIENHPPPSDQSIASSHSSSLSLTLNSLFNSSLVSPSSFVRRFDIILGSYILYDIDTFPALVSSIFNLLDPSIGICYLTNHEPTRERLFMAECERQYLDVETIEFVASGFDVNEINTTRYVTIIKIRHRRRYAKMEAKEMEK